MERHATTDPSGICTRLTRLYAIAWNRGQPVSPLLICDGTVAPVKAKISIRNDINHPIVKSNKISESGDLLLLIIYGITVP